MKKCTLGGIMTVKKLKQHIATLQARMLVTDKQLDDQARKQIESEIIKLRALIGEAILPADSEVESKVTKLLEQTQHIEAPDFSNLVGRTTE